MISTQAQAGLKGKLGIGLAIGAAAIIASQHHHYEKRRAYRERQYVRRQAKRNKVYASKKKAAPKKVEVAEVEEQPEALPAKTAVVSENSSITTAALPPVEAQVEEQAAEQTADETADATPEPAATTVTSEVAGDCKKFFPSVGLTLTVPCE
jgi:hypothetical protein